MAEIDNVYGWIQQRQAPRIAKMGLGELLIYYLRRRQSGVDKSNAGQSNLVNILVKDRLEILGFSESQLAGRPDTEIQKLGFGNISTLTK